MNKNEMLETLNSVIEIMKANDLDEISLEISEFKTKISKKPSMPPMPVPIQSAQPAALSQASEPAAPAKQCGNIVKSPIIGTFYTAAAPGKPPFAKVGTKVSKGSVICIVESMKLMNEITSAFEGTVIEVFTNDGDAVEFDQPLMRIE